MQAILDLETVQDQLDAADIVLASRSDLASQEQLEHFDTYTANLFPKKIHVAHIVEGQVPISLLNQVSNREKSFTPLRHVHGTDHHHKEDDTTERLCDAENPIIRRVHQSNTESTFGWICWKGLIFDAVKGDEWLNRLANLPGSLRTKAVIRTNEGWWGFNFVGQSQTLNTSGYRRDSRIEVIIEGPCEEIVEQFEQELNPV